MSLAETLDALTWADLTPTEKRDAVLRQLVEGRTEAEAADMLSVIYGPVNSNKVRGIAQRYLLRQNSDVVLARRVRKEAETRTVRARARALKPEALPRPEPLPVMPVPEIGAAAAGHASRVTIFDLTAGQCRAPLWGNREVLPPEAKFYCAKPATPGTSYCTACAERLRPTPAEVADARRRRKVFAERPEPQDRRGRFS